MKIVRKPVILTKSYHSFKKFIKRLEGEEGCNFHRDNNGKISWYCDNTTSRARKILDTMYDIDIENTLKYFDEQGGYCDCEIVLNVGKKLRKYLY